MSVYVDELKPVLTGPLKKYGESCHLWAESGIELDAMAVKLGLNNGWKHHDHYDLTRNRRRLAVKEGAIQVTSRELVKLRRKRA